MNDFRENALECLFEKFSYRLNNENDISDITWAFCETSNEFKRAFITFFFDEFKNIPLSAFGFSLKREYLRNNCRPDFYFKYYDKEYIIEIKKGDIQDHFIEYKKTFPEAKFGWIANYSTKKQPGIEIRTWEKFKIFLEQSIPNEAQDKSLSKLYIQYLKQVCSILNIETMRLDNSLLFLLKLIRNIIEEEKSDYENSIYRNLQTHADYLSCTNPPKFLYIGEYFLLKHSKIEIRPWFGVCLQEESPLICIYLRKRECESLYEMVVTGKMDRLPNGKYFEKPYCDTSDETLWFEMKNEFFEIFNKMNSVDDQEKILHAFFSDVLNAILLLIIN